MRMSLLALVLVGCGTAEADLVDALPQASDLTLDLPAAARAGKPAVGETARLYLVTRETTERLNGMIGSALGQLWAAAHDPPPGHRLLLERRPASVVFRLEALPERGGEPTPIVTGEAALDGLSGRVHVHGPGLFMAYDRRDGVTLALHVDQADYRYAQRASVGSFVFATGEGVVRARWLPGGSGRAEIGNREAGAVECWDDRFRRVFFAGPGGTEGDPAACPDVR